jgi:hypothetical protein
VQLPKGMLGKGLLAILATTGAFTSGRATAGVYDSAEFRAGVQGVPADGKASPFAAFRDRLTELFTVGIPQPESPSRIQYLRRARELAAAAASGRTSVPDLIDIDLGAVYIRLGQVGEAIDVLTRASARDRRNPFVYANLGTADQLEGRWARAIDALQQAKDSWPQDWPGLTPAQLKWFRRAEEYHLKLVRLRSRESLSRPTGSMKTTDAVDDLFGVHFVGENGRYLAGRISAEELKKLPSDAIAIVQQLLIWLPGDSRLYWLLGELLNAHGDVGSAATVFDECLWTRRYDSPLLREHRQIVEQAKASQAPILGSLEPSAPEPPAGWQFDRRLIVVGSAAGVLLIGLLGYLQLREFRKQRNSRAETGNPKSEKAKPETRRSIGL